MVLRLHSYKAWTSDPSMFMISISVTPVPVHVGTEGILASSLGGESEPQVQGETLLQRNRPRAVEEDTCHYFLTSTQIQTNLIKQQKPR